MNPVRQVVPKKDAAIKNLRCSCCGSGTRGRQWWNQDTGYGLCPKCGDWIVNRPRARTTFEELERNHGKKGVHWAIPSEMRKDPPAHYWHVGVGNGRGYVFRNGPERMKSKGGITGLSPICNVNLDLPGDERHLEAIADVPEMLELLHKAAAALPDAWAAVKCKVPRELVEEIQAMVDKHRRLLTDRGEVAPSPTPATPN